MEIYQNKTLEGLLAFIVTTYTLTKALTYLYGGRDTGLRMFIVAVGCGMAELFSGNADNVATLLAYWVIQNRTSDIFE